MWVLESDGDVFHGKRLWLRPGKRFLFGRTQPEDAKFPYIRTAGLTHTTAGGFAINNKTISRKHLLVDIQDAQPADGTRSELRSKVTLEDLNTKIGTFVNGKQIRGMKHLLEKEDVFEVKLGHHEHLFRFTWIPVVLSFSFTKSELKSNPLIRLHEQLKVLDIRVSADYLRGETTHVVARKRNTPKGLQALINGNYIVDHTFVDAIIAATEPHGEQGSALENDFDSNWPNPLAHLPPRGAEPTQRPQESYGPNPTRQDIFDGYTFIFYDKGQFDNLLAPITNGRGKALLQEVEPGVTSVHDFVRYVKNVAGEKGLGEFEDGSEGRGVVVVRYIPQKGTTVEWYSSFMRQVSLHLDHRSIEQSEFLDAILNDDASMLRKPLEVESSSIGPPQSPRNARHGEEVPTDAQSLPAEGPSTGEIPQSPPEAVSPAPRRLGRSRRVITSRFKGFDEDFDTPIDAPPDSRSTPEPRGQTSPEAGLFVSQSENMDVDREPSPGRLGRKRAPSPVVEESEEEDIMDQMAPAAAQLKRRRLAESAARRQRGESTPPPPAPTPAVKREVPSPVAKPKGRKAVDMDVLEHARIQREKAEEQARAEREALQNALDGMDISQIRSLAIVEEMAVHRTAPAPNRHLEHGDDSERWDERWNGRKNFKRFRRQGGTSATARGIMRVIVPLEEVRRKDFGIGDEYWLDASVERDSGSHSQKGKKSRSRVSQIQTPTTQSQGRTAGRRNQGQVAAVEASQHNAARSNHARDEVVETASTAPTPFATPQAVSTASTRSSDRTKAKQSAPPSQGKRAAAESLTNPAAAKRARPMAATSQMRSRDEEVEDSESDDDDDGLGFRFKKPR
ncbi:MAG: hypothetical protein M1818_001345 [Claussenomyces sp. TS43310]|nr:MAG: hypothetical protein M1818_001345 [Claussenomyces sp. TS43310]